MICLCQYGAKPCTSFFPYAVGWWFLFFLFKKETGAKFGWGFRDVPSPVVNLEANKEIWGEPNHLNVEQKGVSHDMKSQRNTTNVE